MSPSAPCSPSPRNRVPRPRLALIAAALTVAAWSLASAPMSAHAGLVVQVQNTTASAGGLGAFDVVLMNTGGTFQVSGFSVELSTSASSGVTFTAATTGTTTTGYLFGSLQLPPLTFATFPTHDFTASDSDMSAPGYISLTTIGQVVGLEHVSYQVASGTLAGPVTVSIVAGANTEILDVAGNLIPITSTNGTITINSSAVPELPSSVALAIAGLLAGGMRFARWNSQRINKESSATLSSTVATW